MVKTNKISFSINKDNLAKLIQTLKDLSKLDDKVLFKFDNEHILIYSLVGEGGSINAFKSFVYNTKELLTVKDFDETIIFIGQSSKVLARNLHIMSLFDLDEYQGDIFFDELGGAFYSDRIQFKADKKLKQNVYGDDPTAMNSQITVEKIKQFIVLEDADFSFDLSAGDFDKIKKLATPDVEMNIFYMNVYENDADGKHYISIGEGSWELTVAETEYTTCKSLAFPKKYFKTIGMTDGSARIYMFDTSLMVQTPDSELLISIEVSI